jgi:hypothetical protein
MSQSRRFPPPWTVEETSDRNVSPASGCSLRERVFLDEIQDCVILSTFFHGKTESTPSSLD